jgi:RimJ/RimL family protein N-acetyltransferase
MKELEKIEIRKATPKDANAVASFFRKSLSYFPYVGRKEYPESKKEKFISAIKKKEAIFCLAFTENKVIGVCSFFHKKRGRIRIRGDVGITISPQWQNRGVGTKMLQALIKEARKKGLRKLEAEVVCKNKPSVVLFKKVGFRVEGKKRKTFITDDGKIIDTYVMGLVLR